MGNILIGDIECNGLRPNIIWMVGIIDFDTRKYTPYFGDSVAEGIMRLADADAFVGHNIEGYDVPVMERLTSDLVKFNKNNLIDTLPLSKKYMKKPHYELENYKLDTLGEWFGIRKLPFKRFDVWDPDMIPYCERDCEITLKLFEHLIEYL